MRNAYVVTGTMNDERTLTLDEPLPVGGWTVRVVVEPLAAPAPQRPVEKVLAEIHERQRLRGHKPRTREEVDADLRAERDSWDEG